MNEKIIAKLEGLHTLETTAETLGITKQSALNLLSKLKREGYVTVEGGGRIKRLYKISLLKQRFRYPGMFDIINKYSSLKLQPWYDHQVHGHYGPEEALIDAIQTESFRAILASLRLFNHITDWSKLHHLSQEKDCWQKVGVLYDLARLFFRVRRMPATYQHYTPRKWQMLTQLKKINFPEISERWKVYLPFNQNDLREIA